VFQRVSELSVGLVFVLDQWLELPFDFHLELIFQFTQGF
jgi:hypothetical protein